MKFNELKEQVQSGVNLSKVISFPYLPFISQKMMINNIKEISLLKDDNGFLKVNYTLKNLFEALYIITNYTNIEFDGLYDDDNNINSALAIEIYDFCKQNKIYEFVLENSDSKDFIVVLNKEIEQEIEINNSTASILSQTLKILVDKLPNQDGFGKLLSDLPNILSGLNKPIKKRKTKE